MEIFFEERKKNILIWSLVLILILALSILFIKNSIKKDIVETVPYSDNKSLEYRVMLKENNYYKSDFMEKGNQYIASLINYVTANFKYDFDLQKDYEYNYAIIGTVEVTDDKTNKTIYTFSENLLNKKTETANGKISLDENITIDFNKYNNVIKEFVSTYELKNVTCNLKLKLDFGVTGINESFKKDTATIMSLDIPLSVNTIAIDANYDETRTDNCIDIQKGQQQSTIGLIIGIALLVIDFGFFIILLVFIKKTTTDEDRYHREIKKIINNYDSYISKVDDDFNMKGYQILKVKTFTDLLEIRDTMQLPIIMIENKEQCITCFAIPTSEKILYFYSVSVRQYALSDGSKQK